MPSSTQAVSIDAIIADSRCQSRTGIDLSLVQEYADAIKEGAALPPLSTIHAKEGYYLYDGFHRIEAYRQAGKKHVVIETEPGDVWDAIERSCAVNAIHGKRRTNADKHRAVETMLKVMQHKGENWSDREIARRCAVSNQFVSNIRPDLSVNDGQIASPRTALRNGSTYEMNTANIGKKWQAPDVRAQLAEDVDEDTGEILDAAPPPYEEIDPADPSTWFSPAPQRPTPTQAPAPHKDTTALDVARKIVAQYGRTVALEIAGEIRRLA